MEQPNDLMEIEGWVDRRLRPFSAAPADWTPDTANALQALRRRGQKQPGTPQAWAWAAGMTALAAAACLLVFPSTRALASRCVDACGELVARVSIVFPLNPASGELRSALDFTLMDQTGAPVSLSNFKGKVVLLNFWATWCPPCAKETPWFVEFQRTYAGQGLVVLGVSLDEDGWTAVRPFIAQHRVDYRMMTGGDQIAALFGGVKSLPATFLVDRQGRIALTYTGLVPKATYDFGIRTILAQ